MNQKFLLTTILLLTGTTLFFGCKKESKPIPVANFSYAGANIPAPATVTFTNSSSDATSYSWDFGDNGTSTEASPQHTYITGGVFTVKLTATGDGGTNSTTKTVNIQNPIGPVADFTISGSGSQAPCIITFTNNSQNATTYNWDFGDGQTSDVQNPTHTFSNGGNFNVRLTASGPNGTNDIVKSVNILPAPTICKIVGISILSCPLTDGSGIDWDPFSSPDFYFNLESSTGEILIDNSSNYYTDNITFPLAWTFNPATNISKTAFGILHKVHILEHDNPDADDDVSSVSFRLSSYTTVNQHYPSKFTITYGSTQVQVTVQWQ